MATGKFALALALGLLTMACGDDGGGGGSTCPGVGDSLVGACGYGDGTCTEYRGGIAPAEAQADCAADPPGDFGGAACPAASKSAGLCAFSVANGAGTIVTYQPTLTADQLAQACAEMQGCYDGAGSGGGGGGGGECPGTDDSLVGACVYDAQTCTEYRGGFAAGDAEADCAVEPAGTFQGAACPNATRASGTCSGAAGGGTIVYFAAGITPAQLQQSCAEIGGCYDGP